MYNAIIVDRKKEADYSGVIPIAITVRYITPNGKIAYHEVSMNNNDYPLRVLQQCFNEIAQSTSTPPIIIE